MTSGVVLVLVGLGLGLVLGMALGALAASARVRSADAAAAAAAAARVARLEAELAAERRSREEFADHVDGMRDVVLDQFRGLSSEALTAASRQFLTLAEQRLDTSRQVADGDLARRQHAVAELVRPLGEALDQVRDQVVALERERASQSAALAEQIRSVRDTGEGLRRETAALVAALRRPQARGAWGELHLRRSVEAAGMVDRVDFVEQESTSGDDGRRRPDMVVRLTGGKNVVVDAKVPLEAFLDAAQSDDEVFRAERMKAHARHVRSHVDGLSAKAYWRQFSPTPEFVVMFVPGESFLSAALEADPTLLEYAFDRKVILASPSTLVAVLRTVAYSWSQESLAENAQRVLDLGKQLAERLDTLSSRLDRLGRSLGGSVEAFNQVVGSYDRRVLVTARRFVDLAVAEHDFAAPGQVEVSPRPVPQTAATLPSPARSAEGATDVEAVGAVVSMIQGDRPDRGRSVPEQSD